MKLQDQVCRLELSKRLKELGVGQDSNYWWGISKTRGAVFYRGHTHLTHSFSERYSAFTVAELFELSKKASINFMVRYNNGDKESIIPQRQRGGWEIEAPWGTVEVFDKLADGLAKMLIWLIENGHITADE